MRARILGPIARVLVNREIKRGGARRELAQRLAGRINDPVERERFLDRFGDD